jgi:putative alpha-1,2-mannosidase
MITSMLQDYKEGGWMPMWKNIVETNIMVGTHSDAIIAQAMQAGGSATQGLRPELLLMPEQESPTLTGRWRGRRSGRTRSPRQTGIPS